MSDRLVRRRVARNELVESFVISNLQEAAPKITREAINKKLTLIREKFLKSRVDVRKGKKMASTSLADALLWRHCAKELEEKVAPIKRANRSRTISTNPDHQLAAEANTPTMQAIRASNKMILKTTLSLIVIALAVAATSVCCQENYGPDNEQLDSSQAIPSGELGSQQQQQQLRQVSISTEPYKQVRIECKLPQLVVARSNGTSDRTFYWNFQRTSSDRQSSKPDLLCWGASCYDFQRRGIELEFDRANGDYNLLIRNATFKDNDGIYYCEYRDTSSDISHSTEIQLTILIPPQPPTIAPSNQIPPREGQEYQLNCQSFGGNPEPNITWFKGEQVLLPGSGIRIDQSRHNGTATSTLTWTPNIEDHNATYRCSVTNRAMSQPQAYERETTLHVEFAPRISVGPYNPLKVIQGDSATLSCQVDAHPPVKGIRWFRDGQLVSTHYNHTIYDVKIQDSGVYSCQADNGIAPVVLLSSSIIAPAPGQTNSATSLLSYFGFSNSAGHDLASKTLSQAQLVLDVQYAPRVKIQESRPQPLNERETYSLNCSVDSSPAPYEFVWTKQDDSQTVRTIQTSSSPTLEFPLISASDMGNYTCTAYNRLEPSHRNKEAQERFGSASVRVLVRHQPGVAEISVGLDGITEKGNRTEIQCRAKPPGYPEPKYSFWKLSGSDRRQLQNKQSSPVYTIHSAKADDETSYSCLVVNELGQSTEATGELLVNETPTITRLNTDMWPPKLESAAGLSHHALTIQATGKPEPKVKWFHRSPIDGHRIELSSAEMQTKFQISVQSNPEPITSSQRQQYSLAHLTPAALMARQRYTVISTLTFKQPLDIEDRGTYWAEFCNGLSRCAVEQHQLLIPHPPIAALRNMMPVRFNLDSSKLNSKILTADTRAGYNQGEQVNLTCRVSAWPTPEFVWYHQARGSNASPRPIHDSLVVKSSLSNPYDDIFEHSISFPLISEEDYGGYLCASANMDHFTKQVGPNTNIVVNLGPKTTPEPPVQVEQIDGTQDSVTIQWIPGFDGGFPQNEFIVQYAADDGSGLPLTRRFNPSADLGVGQILDSMGNQADSQQQQQSFKVFYCSTRNPCTITDLQPRQAYLMRLKAKNELGSSEFSDDINVSTRANVFQIPVIQNAYFDSSRNMLHYSLEQNPEYLLNSLEMRIEIKGGSNQAQPSPNSIQPMVVYTTDHQHQVAVGGLPAAINQDWRRHLVMPLRASEGELAMNMSPAIESLRLTLCSRMNESFCGPEFIVSTQSPNSLFLKDQHSLSMSILVIGLFLLIVLIVTATSLHSRCLSRKAKKAASLDRTDHTASNGHHHHSSDSKQPGGSLAGHINGGLNLNNGSSKVGSGAIGSHGSTTSTNSTSAGTNGQGGQMQSLDSINHMNNQHLLNGGSSSDHSSDHSRQAKLDSMPPPIYSHHADRASLMLEQQHQAFLQDKLSSPFGLPANSLMSNNNLGANGSGPADVNGQLMGDYFGGYGQNGATMTSLEHRQLLEATGAGNQHSMMMGSMLGYEPNDGQQMYATNHQALVDDYNYNNAHLTSYPSNHQDQMIESAYGTTGTADGVGLLDHQTNASSLMMAQTTQASFDNSANQTYLGYPNASNYDEQQQQRHSDTASSQYQHDLAAAQQQMYGTLTRTNNISQPSNSSPNQNQAQQYLGSTGLMPPPPLPPPPPPQESDYGTTGGGRSGGRLIREIIV